MMPSNAPGKGGMGAVFICPVCGRSFCRTMDEQEYCSAACMEKAKTICSEKEEK